MNNIKKVLSAWMLVACVLPVAAQYPVIPDSVKARAAKQEAEEERDMTHSRKQHKAFCLFPGSADNRFVVEWISKTGVESGVEMKIKNIGVQ